MNFTANAKKAKVERPSDPTHLAAFPFVEKLRKNRRSVGLPGYYKTRLLRVAFMLDVAENKDPALAQVFVEFAARCQLGGQTSFLYVHLSSIYLCFVKF